MHAIATECLGLPQLIEHQAGGVFDGSEWLPVRVTGRAGLELCEGDKLSRTNDLRPAARRARAIVDAELDHARRLAVGGWRSKRKTKTKKPIFSSHRSIAARPRFPS